MHMDNFMKTFDDLSASIAQLRDSLISRIRTKLLYSNDGPTPVEYGNRYHITEQLGIELPLGRETNGIIHLSKVLGVGDIPISVHTDSTDVFLINGQEDTEIVYDTETPLTLWWNSDLQTWTV